MNHPSTCLPRESGIQGCRSRLLESSPIALVRPPSLSSPTPRSRPHRAALPIPSTHPPPSPSAHRRRMARSSEGGWSSCSLANVDTRRRIPGKREKRIERKRDGGRETTETDTKNDEEEERGRTGCIGTEKHRESAREKGRERMWEGEELRRHRSGTRIAKCNSVKRVLAIQCI